MHGLPWSFSWQDLNDLLRPAGNIVHSDIMLDSSGRSKGYGTAIFETPRDAQNAIEVCRGCVWLILGQFPY